MFGEACAGRELAEERRLAYVAATRAAFWLACTGYWWGEGVSRLGPSAFLDEVRGVCQAGEGVVAVWAAEPQPDTANPALAEPATAPWPAQQEVTGRRRGRPRRRRAGQSGHRRAGAPSPDPRRRTPLRRSHQTRPELLDAWARETELLLAERARRRSGGHAQVALPRQLPVSALVTMARDPAELARQCAVRCRANPPRRPGAAPISTAGSRSGRPGAARHRPAARRRRRPGRGRARRRARAGARSGSWPASGPTAASRGRGAVRDRGRRSAHAGPDRRRIRRSGDGTSG